MDLAMAAIPRLTCYKLIESVLFESQCMATDLTDFHSIILLTRH